MEYNEKITFYFFLQQPDEECLFLVGTEEGMVYLATTQVSCAQEGIDQGTEEGMVYLATIQVSGTKNVVVYLATIQVIGTQN